MDIFCKKLPKIELHAHLNGSLSQNTLTELQKLKNSTGSDDDSMFRYKIDNGHSRTLTECFEVFKIAQALTDTPAAVKLATSLTLQEFAEDGVIYFELRSTPRSNSHMSKLEYVQSIVDAIINSQCAFSLIARLLISIDRRNSLEEAEEIISVAIEMNSRYPEIVVGLDLSGDPRVGTFKKFTHLFNKARDSGLKVTVHTAETPSENETLEILEWKPDRLGHVTCNSEKSSGSKNLWEAILRCKIPIELCLTSNIKSGTVKSYGEHHFKPLFDAKHPLSICTDDKGVFGSNLSEEYYICANTFNLTEAQLWDISYKTILQIFAGDDVKSVLSSKLLKFKKDFQIT